MSKEVKVERVRQAIEDAEDQLDKMAYWLNEIGREMIADDVYKMVNKLAVWGEELKKEMGETEQKPAPELVEGFLYDDVDRPF